MGRASDEEANYPYQNALWKNRERIAFVTKDGYVGLRPRSARAGDVVL
jgi:hypothetical protein